MVSERMLGLGTARSVIRELFEYGKQRAAVVGPENVFDFSLGNPSVPGTCRGEPNRNPHPAGAARFESTATPAPRVTPPPASALPTPSTAGFGGDYTADQLYITVGAAASLCCVFGGLTCPGDEFVVFAPYFPEYKVFIEGARGQDGADSAGNRAFPD